MIGHVSIGVRKLAGARRFYDAALAPLGYRLLADYPGAVGYGKDEPQLWVLEVERPVPANEKSGLHLCLTAPSRASVDRFHKAALAADGKDNGGPGLRADYGPNYYAAFVIDPDGYRIEAHCGLPV